MKEKMLTLQIPKKEIDVFLRVVEDIKFIKEAERGDEEIERGKFKTLEQIKSKYKVHS